MQYLIILNSTRLSDGIQSYIMHQYQFVSYISRGMEADESYASWNLEQEVLKQFITLPQLQAADDGDNLI